MKIFKREAKFGKNQEPLGDFLVNKFLSAVWMGFKGVGKGFNVGLIGLSWLPIPPLRWVALEIAVDQGWLKTVQRLATKRLFRSMPASMNYSLVLTAGDHSTKNYTKDHHIEIFNTLMRNGGVLSKQSFYRNFLFSYFTLHSLMIYPERVILAIENNAVHDDTKLAMFMESLQRISTKTEKLSELMMDTWHEFFSKIQHDTKTHEALWEAVLKDGRDEVVRQLILCTPQELLTPQRFKAIFSHRTDISLATLNAIVERGFEIEDLLHNIIMLRISHSQIRTKSYTLQMDEWLNRNPALKEFVEHARNIKQKERLVARISDEENTEPAHIPSEASLVQRKRKM